MNEQGKRIENQITIPSDTDNEMAVDRLSICVDKFLYRAFYAWPLYIAIKKALLYIREGVNRHEKKGMKRMHNMGH